MNKQFVVFLLLSLVIGFLLGATLIVSLAPQSSVNPNTKQELEIKKAFVQELRQKGILPPVPETITDVYGKASDIKDNQLTVVLENRFEDPLNEFLPKAMVVVANDKTKISRLEEKDSDTFDKEQRAFDKKMQEYGENVPADIIPPEPFNKVNIKISDIKAGDTINAYSETDLKGKSEFVASSIEVQPRQNNPETQTDY